MIEPDFIRSLSDLVPGVVSHLVDRYQIQHSNGDVSTIWLRTEESFVPSELAGLDGFYRFFDGADLLSSTFKIASTKASRRLNGVEITPTLSELLELLQGKLPGNLQDCIPFMTEAGVWIYLFDPNTSIIRKWNLEDGEECDSYLSLNAVIEEWVDVVGG